ncbi:MAG: exosortase N [Bacteroidia bacterium]
MMFTKEKAITAGLILLVILAGIQNLAWYVRPEVNVILCLMMAPLALAIKRPGEYSVRYGWLSAIFLLGFHFLQMQVLFLMGMGAAVFMILEARHGKMGVLPLILLILISPMLQLITGIFTFPIRLEMSRVSALILQKAGMAVSVSGNIFETGGMRFAVDKACMGLNTIIAGLIITTLLIAHSEKRFARTYTLQKMILFYGTTILLLLAGNFIRILMIVIFKSPAETVSHEMIGLGSLVLYVAVPMFFLIRYFKPDRQPGQVVVWAKRHPVLYPVLLPVIVAGVFMLNLNREAYRYEAGQTAPDDTEIAGMEKEILENGLTKFTGENMLIYIKPPCRFWRADHSPAVCWQASGYEMEHIRVESVQGKEQYFAELKKGEEILYTTWWYENDKHQTISQFDWRLRTLKGELPFRLVNITAADRETLTDYCKSRKETEVFL